MAIDTESKLIAALGTAPFEVMKAAWSGEGAGTYFSLWKIIGDPVAGANPPAFNAGSGYVPTKATTGALPIADAPSGETQHVLRLTMNNSTAMTIYLEDVLWQCSGFNTTVTPGAQTITTPGTLPSGRDPKNGADVFPWLEVYTAPGATGATWTLTGTDANGNAGVTWTYTHPANAESIGQMMPLLPGTATCRGIRVPTSLTCSASSGTAGNVGLNLRRKVTTAHVTAANITSLLDVLATGKQRVYDDSCLAFRVHCSASASGIIEGTIELGSG